MLVKPLSSTCSYSFIPMLIICILFRWNVPLTGDKKTDDDILAFANARQRILSQAQK